jgi:arylsulfatase A-like enzyme
MEPWGGLIETPNINRLAANGLTYTNWHTTALCSPTRSSLLTGRNHTTNGMACILNTDLTDKAIEFVKDARMVAPEKPFFTYFCPGATHPPHHAPEEWVAKYKGRFEKEAIVDVSGEHYVDLEIEAVAMMKRE